MPAAEPRSPHTGLGARCRETREGGLLDDCTCAIQPVFWLTLGVASRVKPRHTTMLLLARRVVRGVVGRRQLGTHLHGEEFRVSRLEGHDAGVFVFTMERPATKNALGKQMMKEVRC